MSVIDTPTNTVMKTVTVGSRPDAVAITPIFGTDAYVANQHSNTVSVINTSTDKVVTNVGVGYRPEGIAITPNRSYAYVTNYDVRHRERHQDCPPTRWRRRSRSAAGQTAVTVDPGGSYAYVTNYGSNTVSIIRLSTNMVGKTVGVGAEPDGVAVTIRP